MCINNKGVLYIEQFWVVASSDLGCYVIFCTWMFNKSGPPFKQKAYSLQIPKSELGFESDTSCLVTNEITIKQADYRTDLFILQSFLWGN